MVLFHSSINFFGIDNDFFIAVFHRILDFKRGMISIRAPFLFFNMVDQPKVGYINSRFEKYQVL